MNQIRYAERDCKDKQKIEKFLSESRIGVIGMNGDDFPYAVPVNFIWSNGSLFFHGMGRVRKKLSFHQSLLFVLQSMKNMVL